LDGHGKNPGKNLVKTALGKTGYSQVFPAQVGKTQKILSEAGKNPENTVRSLDKMSEACLKHYSV